MRRRPKAGPLADVALPNPKWRRDLAFHKLHHASIGKPTSKVYGEGLHCTTLQPSGRCWPLCRVPLFAFSHPSKYYTTVHCPLFLMMIFKNDAARGGGKSVQGKGIWPTRKNQNKNLGLVPVSIPIIDYGSYIAAHTFRFAPM